MDVNENSKSREWSEVDRITEQKARPFQLPYVNLTCPFCGGKSWIQPSDACPLCRHQLILAALASLGGGLPPEKMAEMSIRAADAVLAIRSQGALDSAPPQAKEEEAR